MHMNQFAYVVIDKGTKEIIKLAGISFNKNDVEVNKAYSKRYKAIKVKIVDSPL